jgi:hypothetical protein
MEHLDSSTSIAVVKEKKGKNKRRFFTGERGEKRSGDERKS